MIGMESMIQSVIHSNVLDEEIDSLKRKFQNLECKKEDIEDELILVEMSSMKKPRKEVINWMTNVENAKIHIQQLEQEASSGSGLFKRLQLERRVDNFTTEVKELNDQSTFLKGLTLDGNTKIALLTKRLVGEMFQRNQKMILDRLINGEDSIIGVYGMGGVGKTTLLKHIHNQLQVCCINVSWVTVSQEFSTHKLQHDIAKTVDLNISKVDDEMQRAAQLAYALKKRKDFILILDDIWEHICVKKVGIPIGENGCKLVLTTRSLTVCRTMQCQNPIKVEPLSHEEAWILFMETLGTGTALSLPVEEVAKSLVKECAGLPLGIIILAVSMRGNDDIHEWRNALEEIRGGECWNGDMEFCEVFHVLKLSYDKLNDPIVQECLLYCSLFPEDELIERDKLIEYFIVEKLINGRSSRQSEFDKGHAILNKLECACLLEGQIGEDGKKYVKMHDVVRDMAIIIGRANSRFLVQAGMRLTDIPDEKKWSEDLVRVSLVRNDISSIPLNSSPKCSRLLTLLLRGNDFLTIIPNDFFMHMKMLSVLDLSHTSIESLPTSISNLESLTALLLESCEYLWHVPSLENLTALRRLDLSDTIIEEVPEGMEKLTNLRYLNLYGCLKLEMIPYGMLLELSHIECFMSNSVTLHGTEIANWRKLETFWGKFQHIDDLKTCIESWKERGPNTYTIIVGCEYEHEIKSNESSNEVYLFDIVHAEDTPILPTGVHNLSLEGCSGITSLSHIAKLSKTLRVCEISNCNMRQVICSCCCNVLFSQSLESLRLLWLPMLTDLIERDRISPSSVQPINAFSSLKQLQIYECHGLKRLFTPAQFSYLQSLERLEVCDCDELVEIIGEALDQDEATQEETTNKTISFPPKFSYLDLDGLPELKSLCCCSIKISDSLEVVNIEDCWTLLSITMVWEEQYPPAFLKAIKVEESWWDSSLVVWKHPETKAVLQPFVKYHNRETLFDSE